MTKRRTYKLDAMQIAIGAKWMQFSRPSNAREYLDEEGFEEVRGQRDFYRHFDGRVAWLDVSAEPYTESPTGLYIKKM